MSGQENKLLKQIKSSVLSTKQARLNYLIARRDLSTITVNEYKELLKLTEDIEKSDTVRLKRMAKLADLKGISLSESLSVFGISPYQHG